MKVSQAAEKKLIDAVSGNEKRAALKVYQKAHDKLRDFELEEKRKERGCRASGRRFGAGSRETGGPRKKEWLLRQEGIF
eukprot:UN01523